MRLTAREHKQKDGVYGVRECRSLFDYSIHVSDDTMIVRESANSRCVHHR